ncbi:pentapeptide repeat-containing protein [Gloeothece verrucosa]|uniref:Pentapeptide repeat protein n=1 Tax=Gloeothece verrucosa (strain PCC 7822) TaxID=497965 RepID=E0UJ29_GLOV7|nr:pentapeptide repeat-containing protein [Gloeothece verrucosa]ADN14609.1 pentapeptide repeat protein [Gloeothece verrucosa PCC 7822]
MIENQAVIDLKNKYDAGERNFSKIELRRVDLRGFNLSQANFKGADFSYANLREVDFSGADLSEAFFNEADLTGANLQEANLQGSYLMKAYLMKTNLQSANLSKAYLTGAYLSKSNLTNANLTGAYLNGSKLNGADLTGLIYDATTRFDVNFNPNKIESKKNIARSTSLLDLKVTVEDLLNMFNHLSQISNRYLGNTMTVRYWENARPQSEWLNHFQVKPSAQIQFVGTHKGYLDVSQLRLAQEWVNRFIKVCSQIIQDYPKMIDRKQFVFNLSLLSSDPTQTESDDSDESILTFSSSNEDTIGLF